MFLQFFHSYYESKTFFWNTQELTASLGRTKTKSGLSTLKQKVTFISVTSIENIPDFVCNLNAFIRAHQQPGQSAVQRSACPPRKLSWSLSHSCPAALTLRLRQYCSIGNWFSVVRHTRPFLPCRCSGQSIL